jgi:hypothetical protein
VIEASEDTNRDKDASEDSRRSPQNVQKLEQMFVNKNREMFLSADVNEIIT